MNLPFSFQQKLKVAILLFCIMACTLLIRILEDKSVKNMGIAFASIYNDRLVPATDLFQISAHIYKKMQLSNNYIHDNQIFNNKSNYKSLQQEDSSVDSLLRKFEGTYLVATEKGNLSNLKKSIAQNRSLEKKLFTDNDNITKSSVVYENTLNQSYLAIVKNLSALSKIQSEVGEDLIKESRRLMVGTNFFSTIQFILAIIIGVLIVSILFTSNVLQIKPEKFNLN